MRKVFHNSGLDHQMNRTYSAGMKISIAFEADRESSESRFSACGSTFGESSDCFDYYYSIV